MYGVFFPFGSMTLLLPKSQILMTPSLESRTFSGLRSLCAMFFWWMCISPFSNWNIYFYVWLLLLWLCLRANSVCFWLSARRDSRGYPRHIRRRCFGWACPDRFWSKKNPVWAAVYLYLHDVGTIFDHVQYFVFPAELISYFLYSFKSHSFLRLAVLRLENIAWMSSCVPKQPEPITLVML